MGEKGGFLATRLKGWVYLLGAVNVVHIAYYAKSEVRVVRLDFNQ